MSHTPPRGTSLIRLAAARLYRGGARAHLEAGPRASCGPGWPIGRAVSRQELANVLEAHVSRPRPDAGGGGEPPAR